MCETKKVNLDPAKAGPATHDELESLVESECKQAAAQILIACVKAIAALGFRVEAESGSEKNGKETTTTFLLVRNV